MVVRTSGCWEQVPTITTYPKLNLKPNKYLREYFMHQRQRALQHALDNHYLKMMAVSLVLGSCATLYMIFT